MYKSCGICGRIHLSTEQCSQKNKNRIYKDNVGERKLRSTRKWKNKSIDTRDKANYLCEVCRDKGIITYKHLEVHHIEAVQDNPELLLDEENLVCLCVKHHKQADKGILDKAYLKRLAHEREEERQGSAT